MWAVGNRLINVALWQNLHIHSISASAKRTNRRRTKRSVSAEKRKSWKRQRGDAPAGPEIDWDSAPVNRTLSDKEENEKERIEKRNSDL